MARHWGCGGCCCSGALMGACFIFLELLVQQGHLRVGFLGSLEQPGLMGSRLPRGALSVCLHGGGGKGLRRSCRYALPPAGGAACAAMAVTGRGSACSQTPLPR